MQFRKKINDFFFEKDDSSNSPVDATGIHKEEKTNFASGPAEDIAKSPSFETAGLTATHAKAASIPARSPFYILPSVWKKETIDSPAEDADMPWLDEARIIDIFKKLGLDDSICEDGLAEHNHPGHSSRAEPGGAESWDALARSADTVTFPIFAIDHDHRVIVWNRAMETLTGVAAVEMLGKGDYAYAVPFYGTKRPMLVDYVLIPPDLENTPGPVSMIRAGETYTGEVEEVQVNGRPLRMQGRATRICDEEGRVIAAIQSIGILHPVNAQAVAGIIGGRTDSSAEARFAGIPTAKAGGAVPVRAVQGNNTVALPSVEMLGGEGLLRRKRMEVHTALDQLKATEDELLKNYEVLMLTRAQLIKSERKVREQELFLQCVISDAREGIVALDQNLRYILWNRFMEDLTGIPAKKVLGKRASEMFPLIRIAGADLLLERALSGETVESSDISFLAPLSSKQVWVRVIYSPLYDKGSCISGVIGVIQDTTSRKVMEYALQTTIVQLLESESKYRNVFNAKNVPLLIINEGTQAILDMNEAAVQLYGWSRDEMLEMTLFDLLAEPEKTGAFTVLQVPLRVQMQNHRKKDGSVFPVDISADNFILKGVLVMILSIRDLSSFQKIAESLRIANAKLNLIIGITRHDVLNNLTAVMGYNDLMQSDLSDARITEMLRKQEKAILSIRNHIELTRVYDDLGVRQPQWQNICTIASRAYDQFMHTISFSCSTGDLEIYADPLLERVIYNLFDNSFRYGDGLTGIRISCKQTPGGLILTFEDDGVGIVQEDKERIFSRGFGKHTGMGLFLAREILMITHIEIHETGEYRKGARFEFRIPDGVYRFAGSASSMETSVQEETNLSAFIKRMIGKSSRIPGMK
jgi:PAS domain S-box-containing protein